MEFQHSASMASLPSIAGFSEPISEAEEIESVKRLQQEGDAAFRNKDFATAAACYGEALEIDTDNAQLLARRAVSNIELREYAEARKDAENLIKLNPHVPQGHYLLAVSLDNLQFYGLAISAFLNALHYDVNHRDRLADNVAVVAANLCNFPEETLQKFVGLSPAEKLLEVGANLKQAKQNVICIEVLQSALDLKTLDEHCQQRAIYNIGAAHAGKKDYESAKDYYKQGLSIALKLKNQSYEAEIYCRLSEVYLQDGNLDQGIVYYEKLLSICKDLELMENKEAEFPEYLDENLQRLVHETLSTAYNAVSDFPHALKHARENLKVLAADGTDGISSSELLGKAHFTVASLYEATGDFELSLENFKSYLAITKASKDRGGMGRSYGCLGRVYHKLCNYVLAQSLYEQQLFIAEKLSYHTMQATALRSLAKIHEDLGDSDKALEYLQRFLQISRKLDEFETEIEAFICMGEVHQGQGRSQHAQHYFEQALSLAERAKEIDLAYSSRGKLAQVLLMSREEKDLEKARFLAEETVAYCSRGLEDSKQRKEDLTCLLQQSNSIVQVALKKLKRPFEALEYAETQMRCEFLKTVAKNIASVGDSRDALDHSLNSSATVEDMCKTVNRQSAVVVYLSLCRSCVLSWVLRPEEGCLTSKDQTMVDNCPQYVQELLSLIRASPNQDGESYETEYRALPLQDSKIHQLKTLNLAKSKRKTIKGMSSSPNSEEEKQNSLKMSPSRKLYELLFSSVESLLKGVSSVVIVADKVLSQVPFDALEDEEGGTFGDKFHLTILPCIEALKNVKSMERKVDTQVQTQSSSSHLQSSPTHPIYLDHMLRVVIPPKERPHSIIAERNLDAPKMSQNSAKPSYVSFDSNSYYISKSPKNEVALMEKRFLEDREGTSSTLISNTWSGLNLNSANHGKIQEYQLQSVQQRALVVGNPEMPAKLKLHEKVWEPLSELKSAQAEAHKVAHQLDTEVMVGSKVTKESLLSELPKATLVHLAMYGSWEQGSLACTPNPTSQPLADGSYNQSAYMIGVDDILGLKLQAKMVVMSCCYGNRHRDVQFQLPLAFLVAGAESVILLLWSVPDVVKDKFWHHFYAALQEGSRVTEAVAQAKRSIRQDDRFTSPRYWAAFCILGGDPYINLLEVKRDMLDQLLNSTESSYLNSQKTDVLNIRKESSQVGDAAFLFEKIRQHLSGLLLHHSKHPDVISQLGKLVNHCLSLIDPQNERQPSPSVQPLPESFMTSPSAIPLLNQIGFHFQPGSSSTLNPQVVYPQWDPDALIQPVQQALMGLKDICENGECAHNLARVLEAKEPLLSGLIDVISFTKHMPEVQLKVSDTGVSHLWGHHQARALLVSLGFSQVSQLLMFDGTTANKTLLNAALLVLCSVMGEKGRAMLHRLDIRYLGISTKSPITRSAHKTPIKSAMRSASTIRTLTPNMLRSRTPTAVRLRTAPVINADPSPMKSLPSLNPVQVSKEKLEFSTPWWSQSVKSPEMKDKMRLARSLSDLHLEYGRHVKHARHWQVDSVTPQAQKSLSAIGRPKPRPQVVKVKAGTTPSCNREPLNQAVELSMEAIDQRRDYGHFLLHARNSDIQKRHLDAVQKLFQPYVSRKSAHTK
ncbi:uncharacterized protein [Asterias amurensis]|uniref:uncharacterized protein n=1 Tax=Asterias amurensis TaxID=7602 RepID=UPI003AB57417